MFKWINNFFPDAPNTSQDFVQLIRQSDGTILGWIDETGTPRGSLAVGEFGTFDVSGEVVTFSNITGTLANLPNNNFLQLFKNGLLLTTLGSNPDFSINGSAIILTVPATSLDTYVAYYSFGIEA